MSKNTLERSDAEDLTPDERAEWKRLRKDDAGLRMLRDVLKRSVVLWVTETTRSSDPAPRPPRRQHRHPNACDSSPTRLKSNPASTWSGTSFGVWLRREPSLRGRSPFMTFRRSGERRRAPVRTGRSSVGSVRRRSAVARAASTSSASSDPSSHCTFRPGRIVWVRTVSGFSGTGRSSSIVRRVTNRASPGPLERPGQQSRQPTRRNDQEARGPVSWLPLHGSAGVGAASLRYPDGGCSTRGLAEDGWRGSPSPH